jgi:hypothetical protein
MRPADFGTRARPKEQIGGFPSQIVFALWQSRITALQLDAWRVPQFQFQVVTKRYGTHQGPQFVEAIFSPAQNFERKVDFGGRTECHGLIL